MFQFFEAIGSIFETIVNHVIALFEMLANLLNIIVNGSAFLFAVIVNLPAFSMSFFLVTVSLAILLQIINKGD